MQSRNKVLCAVTCVICGCVPIKGHISKAREDTLKNQTIIVEAIRRVEKNGQAVSEGDSWESIMTAAEPLMPKEGFDLSMVPFDGWGREMVIVVKSGGRFVRSSGFNGRDEDGNGDDVESEVPSRGTD